MKKSAVAVGLLTVGGTILGIVQVAPNLNEAYEPPPRLILWLTIIGIALCVLGILILAVEIALFLLLRGIRQRMDRLLEWFQRGGVYLPRPAELNELPEVREFVARSLKTDGITPLETMTRMWQKNPEILYVIERQPAGATGGRREELAGIRGYFCIFPLTRAASKLVANGQLTGDKIGYDEIVASRSRPSSIYIGGVAADVRLMKPSGFVIALLTSKLADFAHNGLPIYTRPITEEGLRLVREYGFKPLRPLRNGDDGLGQIHVWSGPGRHARGRPKSAPARMSAQQPLSRLESGSGSSDLGRRTPVIR